MFYFVLLITCPQSFKVDLFLFEDYLVQQVDKMMSTNLFLISLACNADPVDGTTLIILSLYKMSHNHAPIAEVKQYFVQLDGFKFRFQKPVTNSVIC